MLSQFLGGIGPAVFLVLTGITLAFLMDRRERQGFNARARWKFAMRRAGYLFSLAFLFRLQLWLFAFPQSPWTDLFKVDILNCMGLAIGLMSVMAIFTTADRIRLCAGLGIAIATAAPLVSAIDWSWLPPGVSAYFGISIGSLLRTVRADQMNRVMQWGTLLGLALILGGQYFSNLPYSLYPKSEFWLDSPGLIVIKLGLVMVMIAFAFLWTEFAVGNSWSWLRQLGTTSLLVYWVHIELVYGRWFGSWKESLGNLECGIYAAILIAAMLGLSVLRSRWNAQRLMTLVAPWLSYHSPRRVSGD
jgi:hypothetical protein